jgi:hypothetical protein
MPAVLLELLFHLSGDGSVLWGPGTWVLLPVPPGIEAPAGTASCRQIQGVVVHSEIASAQCLRSALGATCDTLLVVLSHHVIQRAARPGVAEGCGRRGPCGTSAGFRASDSEEATAAAPLRCGRACHWPISCKGSG